MLRKLFVLCSALVLAGCETTTGPASDLIATEAGNSSLELKNTSPSPVYFMVAERGALALIDPNYCNDPSNCEPIAPGSTKRIAYADITGYGPGSREAIVYHWLLVEDGAGKFRPDSVRSTIVELN